MRYRALIPVFALILLAVSVTANEIEYTQTFDGTSGLPEYSHMDSSQGGSFCDISGGLFRAYDSASAGGDYFSCYGAVFDNRQPTYVSFQGKPDNVGQDTWSFSFYNSSGSLATATNAFNTAGVQICGSVNATDVDWHNFTWIFSWENGTVDCYYDGVLKSDDHVLLVDSLDHIRHQSWSIGQTGYVRMDDFVVRYENITNISSGIVSYYPFDNNVSDMYGNYDLTNNGAVLNATGGIRNGAYFYNENANLTLNPVHQELGYGAWSISFWVKPNSTLDSHTDTAFGIYNQNAYFQFRELSTVNFRSGYNSADHPSYDMSGDWKHVVVIREPFESKEFLYINDVLIDENTYTTAGVQQFNELFILGSWGDGDHQMRGFIDEVIIYDKALNAQEVNQLWNNGNAIDPLNPAPDATDTLNITSTAPDNGAFFTADPVFFYANISAQETFNVSLYINGILNQTQTNVNNGTNVEIEFNVSVGNTENTYTYFFQAMDSNGDENSSTKTIDVDNVFPNIVFTTPANNNGTILRVGENLTSLILIEDPNLYSYRYNISYLNLTPIYGVENLTMTGISAFNITDSINMSAYPGFVFNASVEVCDGHTDAEIDDFETKKENNKMSFDEVDIYLEEMSQTKFMNYYKTKDRYKFDFETKKESKKQTFIVESDNTIQILNGKTEYAGHLVTGKKWIDFEMPGIDYVLTERINDYKVKVTVHTIKATDYYPFESVGELNCNEGDNLFFVFNETESYTEQVVSGQDSEFTLTIDYDEGFMSTITGQLIYNGTNYTGTGSVVGDEYQLTATATAPTFDGNSTNISFHWVYHVDSNSYNTTEKNQLVVRPQLGLCTEFANPVMNLTLRLINGTLQTGEIDMTFNYQTDYEEYNVSFSQSGVQFVEICINENATLITEAQIEYTATGYANFDYFLNNVTVTVDNVQNVSLYLVNGTTSTTFFVKDTDDDEVEGAFIQVLEYDVGTGIFTTTQILKTDSDGKAIGEIVLNDKWYKFFISYDGINVLETTPVKITSTTKTFRINLETDYLDTYSGTRGISSSLTFNNDTNTFAYTFSDPSGAVNEGCLKVIQRGSRLDTLIANNCTSSAAATLYVTLPNNTADYTYLATGEIRINPEFITDVLSVSFAENWQIMGKEGLFITFLLLVGLAMGGMAYFQRR